MVGPGFFHMPKFFYDFSPHPITSPALAPRDFLENAETALLKPYGGGEQNLFNFAYCLYNLKYLKATNQLRPEVQQQALDTMNIGT